MNSRNPEHKYFWKEDRWNGALSEDSRVGDRGSARFMIGCDIRSDSGYLAVAKKPVKHDNNQIQDPIFWMEEDPGTGDAYYYGGRRIYKEVANVTTPIYEVTEDGANGQGLRYFDKAIYFRSPTKLGRLSLTTGTFNPDFATGLSTTRFWGPMENVKNVLLFGHGRFIGTVDDVGFVNPEALKLPPGYFARHIFRAGSYGVILATFGEQITDSEKGMMFLWDTTSDVYNDFIPLDGNPHAGISHGNKITIICGQQPTIQESLGGQTTIVQGIPRVEDGRTAEVYPGAIDIWRNMVHFGISGGTSDRVIRALYNYGAKNTRFTDVLNPEFPTSNFDATGDMNDLLSSGVQITACKKFGTTMRYACSQNGVNWIDQIDMAQYQSQAIRRSLAFDRNSPYEKSADKLIMELKGSLKADESVSVTISPDPYGDEDFTSTTSTIAKTEATVGTKLFTLPMTAESNPIRSRDIHYEVRLKGTGATRPSLKRTWIDIIEDQDQL